MADSDITIVGLQAIGGVSQIVLSWAVDDPNVNGLPYLRFQKAEVQYSLSADMSSPVSLGYASTALADLPISRGETRYYQARAINDSDQEGEWCAAASSYEISGDVLISSPGYWKHPSGLKLQWGFSLTDANGECEALLSTSGLAFGVFHSGGYVSSDDGAAGPVFSSKVAWSVAIKNVTYVGSNVSVIFQVRKVVPSGPSLGDGGHEAKMYVADAGTIVQWLVIAG